MYLIRIRVVRRIESGSCSQIQVDAEGEGCRRHDVSSCAGPVQVTEFVPWFNMGRRVRVIMVFILVITGRWTWLGGVL